MKKTYIAPKISIECRFAEVMQLNLSSVEMQGQVNGDDTGGGTWSSGGEGNNGDWVDSKRFNLWDDWE